MAIVLRRSYSKAKQNMIKCVPGGTTICPLYNLCISRKIGDDKNNADFIDSTILIENGFHVTELPVVVRRLKDLSDIEDKPLDPNRVPIQENSKAPNYHLIQAEFNECVDLRDVFSLLSKCTKITPNIALGAVERIYDLEKNPLHVPMHIPDTNIFHVNIAKGAILDKLLKVIMKTEETRTILNVLNTVSTFMQPHKQKFCDELLIRVVENKLSVEQLCDFMRFLIQNKDDSRYSEIIDKLWIGFIDKEMDINESNIGKIFSILPSLKTSKRTITTLLEQKLADVWFKLGPKVMQDILDVFVEEKYLSLQSFSVVGRWMYTNIHALNEESLLDIITKLTRLNYTDNHIEKAVEKYMKLKSSKIESHILLVGVLNYCMQFQIRNEAILNACSDYIVGSSEAISPSFLKSLVYPYGHLCFDPKNSTKFWPLIENMLHTMFYKLTTSDLCSIILSFIYNGKYPVKFVSKIFCAEYLVKVTNPQTMGALHLIDTSLSLECKDYLGPLLPKDQWSNPVLQDARIKHIIEKIHSSLLNVAGGEEKISLAVSIPNMLSHDTYLIDIMLHPVGLGSNTFNWKLKSNRNENVAVLIHLPDHYCADNVQLVGSQVMKKRHLKILGMKVVGLKYSLLSHFYTSRNTEGLRKYLEESISKAETSE